MIKIVLNKYRNELGKRHRKEYDGGLRNEWCNRSLMRSYQCRPDLKCGTLTAYYSHGVGGFDLRPFVLEILERSENTD